MGFPMMKQLGYPYNVLTLLSVAKILGVIAILVSRVSPVKGMGLCRIYVRPDRRHLCQPGCGFHYWPDSSHIRRPRFHFRILYILSQVEGLKLRTATFQQPSINSFVVRQSSVFRIFGFLVFFGFWILGSVFPGFRFSVSKDRISCALQQCKDANHFPLPITYSAGVQKLRFLANMADLYSALFIIFVNLQGTSCKYLFFP